MITILAIRMARTTKAEVTSLLERFWRERGLTIVLVTHDSAVAARAQRIDHLEDGRIFVTKAAQS
jgi:predicted ABC-type transport system involved in lysophospholipase L1 biosynthesis ATPase subunit